MEFAESRIVAQCVWFTLRIWHIFRNDKIQDISYNKKKTNFNRDNLNKNEKENENRHENKNMTKRVYMNLFHFFSCEPGIFVSTIIWQSHTHMDTRTHPHNTQHKHTHKHIYTPLTHY